MPAFTVNVAGFDAMADINTIAVVLAEADDGTGKRIEIQRSISFDDQDRENGMDTYCLCLDSGATHYGGIVAVRLRDGVLRIEIDPDAQDELGVDEAFVMSLDITPEAVVRVLAGIQRVTGLVVSM